MKRYSACDVTGADQYLNVQLKLDLIFSSLSALGVTRDDIFDEAVCQCVKPDNITNQVIVSLYKPLVLNVTKLKTLSIETQVSGIYIVDFIRDAYNTSLAFAQLSLTFTRYRKRPGISSSGLALSDKSINNPITRQNSGICSYQRLNKILNQSPVMDFDTAGGKNGGKKEEMSLRQIVLNWLRREVVHQASDSNSTGR